MYFSSTINNNNNNNSIFFIYKLLNPLVDKDLKPLYPGRAVSYTEHSKDQISQINTGKIVYVENKSKKK